MIALLAALLIGIPTDTTPPRRDTLAVAVDTQALALDRRLARLEHSMAKLDSLFSGPQDTAMALRYRPISEYRRAGSARHGRTVKHSHRSCT